MEGRESHEAKGRPLGRGLPACGHKPGHEEDRPGQDRQAPADAATLAGSVVTHLPGHLVQRGGHAAQQQRGKGKGLRAGAGATLSFAVIMKRQGGLSEAGLLFGRRDAGCCHPAAPLLARAGREAARRHGPGAQPRPGCGRRALRADQQGARAVRQHGQGVQAHLASAMIPQHRAGGLSARPALRAPSSPSARRSACSPRPW